MAPLSKSRSETVHREGRTPKNEQFSVAIDSAHTGPPAADRRSTPSPAFRLDGHAPGSCCRTLESGRGAARSQNPPADAGPAPAARTCCVNATRHAGGFRRRETRVWCARRVSRWCPGTGWTGIRRWRIRCWPPREGATRKDSPSFARAWWWRRSSIGTPRADGQSARGVPGAANTVPGQAVANPADRESRK